MYSTPAVAYAVADTAAAIDADASRVAAASRVVAASVVTSASASTSVYEVDPASTVMLDYYFWALNALYF